MSLDLVKRVISVRGLAAGVVVVLLLLSALPGLAQSGPETMNFQGRLLDADGNPLTEMHCLRFRLCLEGDNAETCMATKVWPSEELFEYHRVAPATGTYKAGLFTVTLGDPPEPDVDQPLRPDLMYDYDTLYLEIGVAPPGEPCSEVDPEEWATMEPRSQLRASAYAQRSRRVRTVEGDNVALVEVVNTGSGGAIYGQTGSTSAGVAAGEFEAVGGAAQTYGVSATSTGGIGVRGIGGGPSGQVTAAKVGVWGDTNAGIGVLGYASSTTMNTTGVAGWATATSGEVYGVWGSTSSDSGYGVYGKGTEIGVRGEGGTASGPAPSDGAGVWGDSQAGAGVYGSSGTGYGVYGTGTEIGVRGVAGTQTGASPSDDAGVWGDSQNGTGVLGFTSSTDGQAGLAGWANATSGQAYGAYGRSLSEGGTGVYGTAPTTGTMGIATNSSGVTYGIYGQNASFGGAGVYGISSYASGTGVRGQSSSGAGVYGFSASGRGLEGSSGSGIGVYGTSLTTGSKGVATAMSGTTYGVYGSNGTSSGAGVYGKSEHANGLGVHGHSDGSGEGVRGTSINGNAVAGYSTGGNGILGTSSSGYGVYSEGNAHVEGNLSWQAKTGYVSIPAAAFHPSENDFSFVNDGHSLRNVEFGSEFRRHYFVLVQLPHGATITKFTFHYYAANGLPEPIEGPCTWPRPTPDDGLCVLARIGLLRTDFTGLGSEQLMAELREVETTAGEVVTRWTNGISYATIDNASYAYYVWAGLVDDPVWLTGVQIEYLFSETY